MKPKSLMWMGAWCGAVALFGSLVMSGETVMLVILGFGGGMVFGKGYGIFEERTR